MQAQAGTRGIGLGKTRGTSLALAKEAWRVRVCDITQDVNASQRANRSHLCARIWHLRAALARRQGRSMDNVRRRSSSQFAHVHLLLLLLLLRALCAVIICRNRDI